MKKKIFSKIIALLLAGISTVMFAAWSGNSSFSNSGDSTESQIVYDYEYHRTNDVSTHEVSVKKTDKYLVENGTSEYKIVYSASADADELLAYGELADLIEESTGVRLATVSDTGLTYSDGAKYIVLGRKNAIYTSAGFNLDTNILKGRGFYV